MSLFEIAPGTEVVRFLVPGASTERYRRVWHVGRTERVGDVLFGKLGFEGTGSADLWSDQDLDFQETVTPAGVAAPFAISLTTLALVFQTRGQDIKVTSFTRALQGILRQASGDDWQVEAYRTQMTFDQWRSSVDRVTQMRFHLNPPNPNYQGRPTLEKLIADASLAAAEVVLRSDDGIVTTADIVDELLQHVALGYGSQVSVGPRTSNGEVVESVYASELQGESEVRDRPVNPETGEVERETLRAELSALTETGPAEHG